MLRFIKTFLRIWSMQVYYTLEQKVCDFDWGLVRRWKGRGYVSLEWTSILIGGNQKMDPILIEFQQKASWPPPQSISENNFTNHFLFLTLNHHICINADLAFSFLLWALNWDFLFKTRPIFCQTLWLRTFKNYLLVESAFVVRNSRTLLSKLYHPCFL